MTFLLDIALNTWAMIAEMGAFLLLGFAISVILHRYLKQAWVERLMGKSGLSSILWGSVVGVPMPLCSCGVIPVTMSLRDKGASKGATVSFLTSTPQTGVDSILATYAMLGPAFTIYKVIVAFLSGIAVGILSSLNLFEKKLNDSDPAKSSPDAQATPLETGKQTPAKLSASLKYGFYTMPGDLASALLIGFVLAGLISALVPANLLADIPGGAITAILVTTVISVPFYICSTGSIPLALALIHSGLPVSAALVLLIAGPATNITTITTMRKVLGGRSTFTYVAGVVLSTWIAAAVYHYFIDDGTIAKTAFHLHEGLPLWKHLGGIALIAVLLFPSLSNFFRPGTQHLKAETNSMKTTTLTIEGMNCSHCESSVRNGLAEIAGADNILAVDRNTNSALIQGDSLEESAIRQKIESLGFDYKGQTTSS